MNGIGSNTVGSLLAARRVQVLITVLASAAGGWVIASSGTRTLTAVGVSLVAGTALLGWPALTALTLLILCQELDPAQGFGGPSGSGLLFLGHQVYFTTVARASLLTLALVLTAARVAVTMEPSRPRRIAAALMLALGAYYAARVWSGGSSITSALNQDSRFAILFVAGFVIGTGTARNTDWANRAVPVLLSVLSGMALLGVYLVATGQGEAQTGLNLIFYDSAMGAIAGAAVLAAISAPASQRDWRIWGIGAAGLVVVVLSSRRNVYAAMAVALLLGLLFGRNRTRLVLRLLFASGLACAALLVFFPTVISELGHQLSAIWGATQGTAADASAKGHLNDVSLGWNAVKASPISGVGPGGHIAGLVVQSRGQLYIHNQVLESWLRFGLLAAVLVVAVQLVLVVQALGTLNQPGSDFMARWAAQFLLIAPVASLTAPFLTNTQRWPAILGLAAGIVATAHWKPAQSADVRRGGAARSTAAT
jgi:O-antigen ligase